MLKPYIEATDVSPSLYDYIEDTELSMLYIPSVVELAQLDIYTEEIPYRNLLELASNSENFPDHSHFYRYKDDYTAVVREEIDGVNSCIMAGGLNPVLKFAAFDNSEVTIELIFDGIDRLKLLTLKDALQLTDTNSSWVRFFRMQGDPTPKLYAAELQIDFDSRSVIFKVVKTVAEMRSLFLDFINYNSFELVAGVGHGGRSMSGRPEFFAAEGAQIRSELSFPNGDAVYEFVMCINELED